MNIDFARCWRLPSDESISSTFATLQVLEIFYPGDTYRMIRLALGFVVILTTFCIIYWTAAEHLSNRLIQL